MTQAADSQSDLANTFRIMVATDCHLGYMEKDEVRREDSFVAFEEVFKQAQRQNVDFVLLGGDLFHENKPSRTTLVKTIEILRKYCLGDRPIGFQVVSDQTQNFPNVFGHVNYEDPHFNVGMPVFTIHGNHDDPAGVDNLSAIDILSSCNLVNYFGKMSLEGSGVGQIKIQPVLLRKGSTKLALYGLGNIRDERLNRMFKTPHAVQWIRPESTPDCNTSDWFNIFVLHQNRVPHTTKNAIDEHMLPRFLDFIIWGHEHECRVDPEEVAGMGFQVSQPGSSVATSLIEGESKKKHILLLEVRGSQWRPIKIPLHSVRPFQFADVSLASVPGLNAQDQAAVLKHLDDQVEKLLQKAAEENKDRAEQMLPLVRIRVDYTGFTTVNPQRFGQKHVGKVANPHDILLFTKSAKRRERIAGADIDEAEKLRPEALDQQNIEALLNESNLKMEILPVQELGVALSKFVSKDEKDAFQAVVKGTLEETQTKLWQEGNEQLEKEQDLLSKINEHFQARVAAAEARQASQANDLADPALGHLTPGTSQPTQGAGRGRARQATLTESMAAASKRAAQPTASIDIDGEEEDTDTPLPTSRGGRGRGRGTARRAQARGAGRGRGRAVQAEETKRPSQRAAAAAASAALQRSTAEVGEEEELSESDAEEQVEELEDIAEEEEEDKVSLSRGCKRPAGRGRGRATPQAKRRKTTPTPTARKAYIEDDEDAEEEPPSPFVGGSSRSQGTARGLSTAGTAEIPTQAGRKWGSLRR